MVRHYFYVEYNVKDTALILAENSEEALRILFAKIRKEHESDPTRRMFMAPRNLTIREIAAEGSVMEASE